MAALEYTDNTDNYIIIEHMEVRKENWQDMRMKSQRMEITVFQDYLTNRRFIRKSIESKSNHKILSTKKRKPL